MRLAVLLPRAALMFVALALAAAGVSCTGCAVRADDDAAPGWRAAPPGAQAAAAPRRWTEASGMSEARSAHTATPLGDRSVLITGGLGDGSRYLGSAEIYEREPGTWRPAGSAMGRGRAHHTATWIPGGVLVAGGLDGVDYLQSAEIYDVASESWQATAAAMADARAFHTATRLGEEGGDLGGVLVAGGLRAQGGSELSCLSRTEIYDPATGAWHSAAPMSTPRAHHAATRLEDGRVLVTGGVHVAKGKVEYLATAEIYDPVANAWQPAGGPMSQARARPTATRLQDGRVLVAGGSSEVGSLQSSEIYDPATGAWSFTMTPLSRARAEHTATLLEDGRVLVAGGHETQEGAHDVELFEPDDASWRSGSELRIARWQHTATALTGGWVLVAGGLSSGLHPSATAELYSRFGGPCQTDEDCPAGYCRDGVCCESTCEGQCVFCATEDHPGRCLAVPPGEDPRLSCGDESPCSSKCSAIGTCIIPGGEKLCSPPRCDDSSHRAEASYCDFGCPPPRLTDCAPFGCDDETGECFTRCRSVNDCAPELACDPAGRCVPPPRNATACSAAPLPRAPAPRGAAGALLAGALAALARRRAAAPAPRGACRPLRPG